MIAYNFHAVSNGARGEAKGGRWELALPTIGQAPASVGVGQDAMLSAERETIRRLHSDADPTEARLLTAVYVSLKTHPCVVLSGRAGAGKAALVQHLTTALVGSDSGQFIRIGSAQWAAQSGQREYYRDLHTRFGDSQLSEVLSEAQSPQGAGKLYFVLFDGLAPDELFHYLHERFHLLPVDSTSLAVPENVLFIATVHQPSGLSDRDAAQLSQAHQINVTAYRRLPPPLLPPPVGLQRAMIRDAVRDVVVARDRLRMIFGGVQLPHLKPSSHIAGFLRWYGLSPDTTLDSDMWLFLANSFDRYGNGLFIADPVRNLQAAYDIRMVQRVMARLDPANAALRPELARAVGC